MRSKGYTLIELMIVVIIVFIIATIIMDYWATHKREEMIDYTADTTEEYQKLCQERHNTNEYKLKDGNLFCKTGDGPDDWEYTY